MQVRFLLLLGTVFALLLSGCQSPPRPTLVAQPPAIDPPLVILLSIDGFRPDYLARELTPHLAAIAADGVRAEAMRPAFPSLTFPNHYSLVTGLVPDHHGLINNTMVDAEIPGERFTLRNRDAVENPAWWNDGQPLWNTMRKEGLRSATMFWPGSEAAIHGHHPDYWLTFNQEMTPAARVQQVLDWVDLPSAERPNFITLYFDEVDQKGHVHGPDSDEVNLALAHTDHAIGQLISGLKQRDAWRHTNLVVVSDHGMAKTPAGQSLALDDYVPRKLFELVTIGPLAGIEPRKGTAAALDAAMSKPIEHAQCWRKDKVPSRFRYGSHRRVPAWICLADEGWNIVDRELMRRYGDRKANLGAHGYDPALDSMAALFIAHGPDFRRGVVIAELDTVDVYPLLARLLRITPEINDGNPETTRSLLRADSDAHSRPR